MRKINVTSACEKHTDFRGELCPVCLSNESDRMRKALEMFADRDNWLVCVTDTGWTCAPDWVGEGEEPWKIAQDAIKIIVMDATQ